LGEKRDWSRMSQIDNFAARDRPYFAASLGEPAFRLTRIDLM
jgi:hypothetical protein